MSYQGPPDYTADAVGFWAASEMDCRGAERQAVEYYTPAALEWFDSTNPEDWQRCRPRQMQRSLEAHLKSKAHRRYGLGLFSMLRMLFLLARMAKFFIDWWKEHEQSRNELYEHRALARVMKATP